MKKMYNTPKTETQLMTADAHLMLLDSGSHADAPARRFIGGTPDLIEP